MLFTQLSECHHKWYFNALLYIGQWGGKRDEAKEDVQIWEVQIHCSYSNVKVYYAFGTPCIIEMGYFMF